MNIKAKLSVRLMADETIIAESEDAALWQSTLAAMHDAPLPVAIDKPAKKDIQGDLEPPRSAVNDALQKLARDAGVSVPELVGAIAPSLNEPHITLDSHCWSAMKAGTAERGPSAYGSTALVATFMALWSIAAGVGSPTLGQVSEVLSRLGVADRNALGGLQRSFWLQLRSSGQIIVNPAHYPVATKILRSFCMKSWEEDPRKD